MAGFTFTPTSGDGCFHIGRKPSILSDGLEFTITGSLVGIWHDENGKLVNKDNGNSIRFKTSISDDDEDSLNINLFLNRRRVIYDSNGRASILYGCEFHTEFMKFLEDKIGRRSDEPNTLIGSAKEVADKCVADFFGSKKLVVKEQKDVFFKTIKDGVEKLEAPYDPVFVIGWK